MKINAAVMGLSVQAIVANQQPQAWITENANADRLGRHWQSLEFESDLATFQKVEASIVRVPMFKFYLPNLSKTPETQMERALLDNFLEVKKFVLDSIRTTIAEATVTTALCEKLGEAQPSSTEDARMLFAGDWKAIPESVQLLLEAFEPALVPEFLKVIRGLTPKQAMSVMGVVAQFGHRLNTQEERRIVDDRGAFRGEHRTGQYLQSGLLRCWWTNRRTAEAPETAEDFVAETNMIFEAQVRNGEYASLDAASRSVRFDALGRANDVLMMSALTAAGIEVQYRNEAQAERRLAAIEAEHTAAMGTDRLIKSA